MIFKLTSSELKEELATCNKVQELIGRNRRSNRIVQNEKEIEQRNNRIKANESNNEVIDLTNVTATTFSSTLADEFEKACNEDKVYMDNIKKSTFLVNENGKVKNAKPIGVVARYKRTFIEGKLVVPNNLALRTKIIRECHDAQTAGHLGRDKTIDLIKRKFYWSGMDQMIRDYVITCEACQKNKPSQQRTPGTLMPIPSPEYAGDTWTVDFITGLPMSTSGNDAIVVFVCKYNKTSTLCTM